MIIKDGALHGVRAEARSEDGMRSRTEFSRKSEIQWQADQNATHRSSDENREKSKPEET
jgi:hypothetical protein